VNYNHKDPFKFILCMDNNITDLSYMFSYCDSLISINEIFILELDGIDSKPNTIKDDLNSSLINFKSSEYNINDNTDNDYFYEQNNQTLIESSISFNENTNIFFSNNENIQEKFPDLSFKINNINNMFHRCESLISLPDISKWNTSNVINMEFLFND